MNTAAAIDRFLASPSLSDTTRKAYAVDVREFGDWLAKRRIEVDDVDVRVLSDYTAELGKARPRKLAPTTIGRKLAAVRSFLRFTLGPARVPDASFAPRRPRRLPDAPPQREVESALDSFDRSDTLSIGNRALVELVYSAGLRSHEAVGLDLGDAAFAQEHERIRGPDGRSRPRQLPRPARCATCTAHRRGVPAGPRRVRRVARRPDLAHVGRGARDVPRRAARGGTLVRNDRAPRCRAPLVLPPPDAARRA